MEQLIFPLVAAVLLITSLAGNRAKTAAALALAWKRFVSILPLFLAMMAAASFVLSAIPEEMYVRYLSSSNPVVGTIAAGIVGSISVMPGFVAFPLAAMLLSRGVARVAISLFTTTLMMVGIVTLPIEMRYLTPRVALVRNLLALGVAVAVALATGFCFGELP